MKNTTDSYNTQQAMAKIAARLADIKALVAANPHLIPPPVVPSPSPPPKLAKGVKVYNVE